MARLRINQGLNLTLDATSTDLQVKSLAGPNNANLLINGRNYGVEIRINEDNYGSDSFRITSGSGGTSTLFSLNTSGDAVVLGKLRVDGTSLGLGSENYVYNTNTTYQIPGADGNARTLILGETTSGAAVLSLNSRKDSDGAVIGSIVWTRETGQSDGHRQVAGIVAFQSGTGPTAGSALRVYVKGAAGPFPVLHITSTSGGRVGIGVSSPTEALEVAGNVKASGNFIGNLSGNASTATKLQTARTISLTGAVSGSASFDGSADVTLSATINTGAVGTAQLADGSVTTAKIADGAVTSAKLADLSAAKVDGVQLTKALSHRSTKILLGNQDWTPLIYTDSNKCSYDPANRGVKMTGETWARVRLRVPVHPERLYRVKAKVRKLSGDGLFYIGAVSLDQNYNELFTDQAMAYNYFGAPAVNIPAGSTYYAEGVISGYNATTDSNHTRFDPEAKYFDLIIIANIYGSATPSETVVEWLELEEIYPYETDTTSGRHAMLIGHPNDMGSHHFGGISIAMPASTAKWPFGIVKAGTPLFRVDDVGNLHVNGDSRIVFSDKRTINVYVDHGGDANTRYYYLGKVNSGNGILKVQGILGGHTPSEGRANVDLQFSFRDGFRVDGEVIGKIERADLAVYSPGDGFVYIYLVTKTWALVNLELSAVGMAYIGYDGTFSYTEPTFSGQTYSPIYRLSTDTFHVLRYTSRNASTYSIIPVNYSLGSGVQANNYPSFYANAYLLGPLVLIFICPDYIDTNVGFSGEGSIRFTMNRADLRNMLQVPSSINVRIRSVQLTTQHSLNSGIYHDHEYHYVGEYSPDSNTFGIQVYRQKFGSADAISVPHIWILGNLVLGV